jgi:hypothetical protein
MLRKSDKVENLKIIVFLTQYDANNRPVIDPMPVNTIQLFLGSRLYHFFEAFKTFRYDNGAFINQFSTITPILPVYLYAVDNLKDNYLYPPKVAIDTPATQTKTGFIDTNNNYTANPPYFVMTQEYIHVGSWSSLNKIVFTTGMPVVPQFVPSLNNKGQIIGGNSSNRQLIDFVPDIERQGNQRQRFIYNPSGGYRYIEINSTVPMYNINFKVYWSDRLNNLYPMTIPYNQSNSATFQFVHKSLIKNYL